MELAPSSHTASSASLQQFLATLQRPQGALPLSAQLTLLDAHIDSLQHGLETLVSQNGERIEGVAQRAVELEEKVDELRAQVGRLEVEAQDEQLSCLPNFKSAQSAYDSNVLLHTVLTALHAAHASLDSLEGSLSAPLDAHLVERLAAVDAACAAFETPQLACARGRATAELNRRRAAVQENVTRALREAWNSAVRVQLGEDVEIHVKRQVLVSPSASAPTTLSDLLQALTSLNLLPALLAQLAKALSSASEALLSCKSSWALSSTSEAWLASPSGSADGATSLVSLLDWLLRSLSPVPHELSRALGAPLLPLLLPQLIPHLRTTLPQRISSPPTAPLSSASLARELRRAIQPLLPPASATSEELLDEADALERFAQRLGKEWGRALAEAARREARALIMGNADGGDEWEPEAIEIDVEVELEGLAPASVEQTAAEDDEWGWGGTAAEEAEAAHALAASHASVRSSSPAGSSGSATAASAPAPRRKGRAALGGVRVVKPADQLGSGPLPEEGADDAWGFDEELDLPTLAPAPAPAKSAPSSSRVAVAVEEPADDAWFDESEALAAPSSSTPAPATSAPPPAPTTSSAAAAYDALAEAMDEEADVDEDAWGLTDAERLERAAKRASMRGVPSDFKLPSLGAALASSPAAAQTQERASAALAGMQEDVVGEAEDPWEVDVPAPAPAPVLPREAPSSASSGAAAPPQVEVEDVDWDLNDDAPLEAAKPEATAALVPTSTLAPAATAPRAASPIALVEPVDEEADGAWGLEEDDEALPSAAAEEELPVAPPAAPLTEPAVAALNASSDSALSPAGAPRPSSVISGTASTVVLPPTPATERDDPVEDPTRTGNVEQPQTPVEEVVAPPLEGSALPLTRSSTLESDAALPGTPVVERPPIEEPEVSVAPTAAAARLTADASAGRAGSPIALVEPVDEEADGAWGLEEEDEDALTPEPRKGAELGAAFARAAAEEELPVAPPSAPLTEPAVAALEAESGEALPPSSAPSATGSTAVLPPTPASERDDPVDDGAASEATSLVEPVIPPPIEGSALPLLRGSTGPPSVASAPGSDAAVPGTPVLERSSITETEPPAWQSLTEGDDRPSTPLVAPPIGGSALPTVRTPSSTRPPSISSAHGSDAAVPGTPVLERAPLSEAAPPTWLSLQDAPQDRPSTPLVAPAIGGSAQPTTFTRSASSTRPASISSAAASDDALPPTTPAAEREEPVFDEHPSRVDTPDIPPPPPAELTQALERAQYEADPWDSVVEPRSSERAKTMPSVSEAHAAVLADEAQDEEEEDEWTAWAEEAAASAPIIVAPKAVPQRSAAARSSSPLAGSKPARVSSPLASAARGTASPQLRQATLRSAVAAEQSGAARNTSVTRSAKTSSSRSSSPARAAAAAVETPKPAPAPTAPRKETCVISTRSRRLIALAKRVLSEAITLSHATSSAPASEQALWPSAHTLAQSVGEILDLHRALVPAVHARALQAPSLAAQFANDCAFVARETAALNTTYLASPLAQAEGGPDLQASANATAALGRRVFDEQLELQAGALDAALDDARGFDRTHEPEREKAVSRAVSQTVALLRQLSSAWAPVLPASARLAALGSLVEGVLARVLRDVAALEDISEKESERLAEIVKSLGPLEELFLDPASGQTAVALFVPSWFKASYLSEILLGSLVDIEFLWAEAGALVDYTPAELASLIRALFADTPNRAKLLERIASA